MIKRVVLLLISIFVFLSCFSQIFGNKFEMIISNSASSLLEFNSLIAAKIDYGHNNYNTIKNGSLVTSCLFNKSRTTVGLSTQLLNCSYKYNNGDINDTLKDSRLYTETSNFRANLNMAHRFILNDNNKILLGLNIGFRKYTSILNVSVNNERLIGLRLGNFYPTINFGFIYQFYAVDFGMSYTLSKYPSLDFVIRYSYEINSEMQLMNSLNSMKYFANFDTYVRLYTMNNFLSYKSKYIFGISTECFLNEVTYVSPNIGYCISSRIKALAMYNLVTIRELDYIRKVGFELTYDFK